MLSLSSMTGKSVLPIAAGENNNFDKHEVKIKTITITQALTNGSDLGSLNSCHRPEWTEIEICLSLLTVWR